MNSQDEVGEVVVDGFRIPPPLSPFGMYPNPLQVTDADRATFHPVVRFPSLSTGNNDANDGSVITAAAVTQVHVMDFTVPLNTRQLATDEEREQSRAAAAAKNSNVAVAAAAAAAPPTAYAIGRYDEDRVGLYESALFDDTENAIDGYAGRRTVHMGIDLDGPVGSPVYAFCPGTVLFLGYNDALGDYGNVIVVEHHLPPHHNDDNDNNDNKPRVIYALYGHLTDDSIRPTDGRIMEVGTQLQGGDVIGYMGNIHENGGWFIPHVHFQLSVAAPTTHDMPGAVSRADRPKALIAYPDPRYVLGPLY